MTATTVLVARKAFGFSFCSALMFQTVFCEPLDIHVVTIGNIYPNVPGAIPYTGPAISSGIQKLRELYGHKFNSSHTFLYDREAPNCPELATRSDVLAAKWYYQRNVRSKEVVIFLFGGCLETYPMNRLAAGWNVLMLTSVTNGNILRDRTQSPTWITGSCVSLNNYMKLYINLLQHYDWTSLYMVLDVTSNPVYLDLGPSLLKKIQDEIDNSQVIYRRVNSTKRNQYKDILLEFSKSSRVFIFVGHGDPLRELMITARNLGMTNGEYVYVAMEVFEHTMFGSFSWMRNDTLDQQAKAAYRSVLLLNPDKSIYNVPSEILVDEWRNNSRKGYNASYTGLNPYTMSSYSTVMMLGEVLNEARNVNLSDGAALAKLFLNRTFHLNFTSMYIDEAGERRTELVIRDLNSSTGMFEVVLLQDPETSRLHQIQKIDWVSVTSPLNEPSCGYTGQGAACMPTDGSSRNIPVLATVFLLAVVVGAVGFRHFVRRRAERRLLSSSWFQMDGESLCLVQRPSTVKSRI